MVLGKLPMPGRPTIWITVGQGPTALAVGAGRGCLDIFTLLYPFFPLSPCLWETEILSQRAVKPKTNQPTYHFLSNCGRFHNLRQELFNKIIQICQPTLDILLFGSKQLSEIENRQIFLAVQEFLVKSKRFEIA